MEALTDWTPDPMEFTEGEGASVWLSSRAMTSMIEAAVAAGRNETGGILIGRYGIEAWNADIVEATPKPKGSKSGWFWFQRSSDGLAALLEQRWRDGLHYLGEWHFHPGGPPTPSAADVRAMKRVADDPAYCCPSPILVILGGRLREGWSLSATLFRDGREIYLLGRHVS